MISRTEKVELDAKIEQAKMNVRDVATFGLPAFRLYVSGVTTGLVSCITMSSSVALGAALPVTAISLVGGGLYGVGYYYRTMEKRLIVQRLISEINEAKDMETLLKHAEDIKNNHSPYLRTERGFYGYTLVQKWVADKYGHTTGNTKSWQDVTAALETKCRELAHGDVENALQQLHERISVQEETLPAEKSGYSNL